VASDAEAAGADDTAASRKSRHQSSMATSIIRTNAWADGSF
jgi:hypothetical protein